eukprot:TRINITY_DN46923_c0_g1_i1.p1 TRINITY_DN46923_c0_g1~~TRINITY_DN46923_c0_g1_i1.p1  ORF type:complete len:710 (+),score=320.27 TRINITY_DN46923_c0_g1_i1:81-2132(+)
MAASPTCGGTGHMLPAERAKASFDSAALATTLRGKSKQMAAKFRETLFNREPFLSEKDDYFRSYQDVYEKKIDRLVEATKIIRSNPEFRAQHMQLKVPMREMFDTAHTLSLHFSMFLTYIQTQTSEEQKKAWLAPTLKGLYNGAYAQTELGHGSNVRGLETEVTYDKATEEFVVHSPTLTSLKWWPTSMYACTHAAVFGRLLIDGKDYGYHAFFVQLRDKDGYCMPGVEIGEIGPKMAGNHANIGYARFTHVRIPRFNMFARSQQVTKEGKYIAAPKKISKFKYISMMHIRVALVSGAFDHTARAATIAIRYSAVRKQGFKDSQAEDAVVKGENTVMDYSVQQYRCFKALAHAYMFYWNARFVRDYLSRIQSAVMAGDESGADEMPELHATLSGLKAWSTVWAHQDIEDCRKACGGQGFLLSSGIAEISRSYTEAVTVEGEQVILSLQAARFLMKAAAAVQAGQPVAGSVTYLKDPPMQPVRVASYKGQGELLLALLRERTRRFAFKLEAAFRAAQARGMGFDKALNSVAVLCYKAAECHSAYIMARNNWNALPEYVKDPATRAVLVRLFELAALQQIHEHCGDWMGVLDADQVDLMLERINELLLEIRPDAVALTDGFGFSDYDLKSTLGRYDGNVYEAIYEEAKRNPLNKDSKMVNWDNYSTVFDLKFLERTAATQRQGKL